MTEPLELKATDALPTNGDGWPARRIFQPITIITHSPDRQLTAIFNLIERLSI